MSNQSENPDVPYVDASSLLRVSTWMSDFERELFSAALRNLHDASNPLRLNNFAFSVRELMRHVLHRLAPDENVLRCPWYANETPTPQGISRRQRALYAVQGGLQDSYVTGILGINSIAQQKTMSRAIEVLNKYTHVCVASATSGQNARWKMRDFDLLRAPRRRSEVDDETRTSTIYGRAEA